MRLILVRDWEGIGEKGKEKGVKKEKLRNG
jgi:hypothetical protein